MPASRFSSFPCCRRFRKKGTPWTIEARSCGRSTHARRPIFSLLLYFGLVDVPLPAIAIYLLSGDLIVGSPAWGPVVLSLSIFYAKTFAFFVRGENAAPFPDHALEKKPGLRSTTVSSIKEERQPEGRPPENCELLKRPQPRLTVTKRARQCLWRCRPLRPPDSMQDRHW